MGRHGPRGLLAALRRRHRALFAAIEAWDRRLPPGADSWLDDLRTGSWHVAARIRTHRRRRGDLLPPHPPEESS